jgi:hypothetical protein
VRSPGPPLRFLLSVIVLWTGARTLMLTWPGDARKVAAPVPAAAKAAAVLPRRARPSASSAAYAAAIPPALPKAGGRVSHGRPVAGQARALVGSITVTMAAGDRPVQARPDAAVRSLPPQAPPPAPQFPAEPPRAPELQRVVSVEESRRWSGSLFLFGRGGGGAVPLAGGGQLGASQAGARIAYRIDDAGYVAAAARLYAPIDAVAGSEAAVGIDLHPLPAVPMRLSVERRIAIGA